MPVSEIILLNVGIAAVLAAILALVMLLPARLDAQHRASEKGPRRKAVGRRAATHHQHAPGADRRGLRPVRD